MTRSTATRALLAAVSAGAALPDALLIAAKELRGDEREVFGAASKNLSPSKSLGPRARFEPPFVKRFVIETEPSRLAHVAGTLLPALERSGAQRLSLVPVLLLVPWTLTALAVAAVCRQSVYPVIATMAGERFGEVASVITISCFVLAGIVAAGALVWEARRREGWIWAALGLAAFGPLAGWAWPFLFIAVNRGDLFRPAPVPLDERRLLQILAAADRASLPRHIVLTDLAQYAPGFFERRRLQRAARSGSEADLWDVLLRPALVRATWPLPGDGPGDALLRAARLAAVDPKPARVAALGVAPAVLLLALGVLLIGHTIFTGLFVATGKV